LLQYDTFYIFRKINTLNDLILLIIRSKKQLSFIADVENNK